MSAYFEQQGIDSWVICRGAHAARDVAGVISETGYYPNTVFHVAMIDHNGESCCGSFVTLNDAQKFAMDNR